MTEAPQTPSDESIAAAATLWSPSGADSFDVTLSIGSNPIETQRVQAARANLSVRHLEEPGPGPADHGQHPDTDFKLMRLLGRGGMGVVYEAHQASLDRDIAIKMTRPGGAQNGDVVGKFLAEAVVTGDLDHPNIVPIYDVGRTDEDALFYAMKKVVGTAWSAVMPEKTVEENIQIFLSVCDAVAFAHDRGVIHRDLKPQNVMLGAYGEVLLMDWGLAVSIGSSKAEALKRDTGLAGTPAYMSPEMAHCDFQKIGRSSDIYLLGGMLYELATGLRPHAGGNVHACIGAAMENLIQPTEKKGELIDISMKALAFDPAERFSSVKDLQMAIRRYQSHTESTNLSESADVRLAGLRAIKANAVYRESTEIIASYQQALKLWHGNRAACFGLRRARQAYTQAALDRGDLSLATSQLEALRAEAAEFTVADEGMEPLDRLEARVRRAVKDMAGRRRLVRFSVAVAVLGGLLALGIVAGAYFVAKRERDSAVTAQQQARDAEQQARDAEQQALAERDRATAAEAAEARLRREAQASLLQIQAENYYSAIALAERNIAEGALASAETSLWNTAEELRGWEWGWLMFLCHRELLTLRGHTAPVHSVAFSSDGKRVVTAAHDMTVVVWDALTGRALHALKTDPVPVVSVAFAEADSRVRVATRDGNIRTWDPAAAKESGTVALQRGAETLDVLRLSDDGQRAIATTKAGRVAIWDAVSGKPLMAVNTPAGKLSTRAVLSRDGQHVALWSGERTVSVGRAGQADQRELTLGELVPPVEGLALSPDGLRLATTGRDAKTRIWDTRTGKQQLVLRGHTDAVAAAAFSADGTRIVTAGHDQTARIWDAGNWGTFQVLKVSDDAVTCLALSPDGRHLLAGGSDGSTGLWAASSGRRVVLLEGLPGPMRAAAFSPDGRRLFTVGGDLTVRVRDSSGNPIRTLEGHTGEVTSVALSPDGKLLLSAGTADVRVWDAGSYELVTVVEKETTVARRCAFSPQGGRFVVAGVQAQILNAPDASPVLELGGHSGSVGSVVYDPEGRRILTTDRKAGHVFDALSGERLFSLTGHQGGVSAGCFSPDGRRIVTGGRGVVKVWHAQTGRELLSIVAHEGWVTGILFSADGRTLVTAGDDGSVKLWQGFAPALRPEDLEMEKENVYVQWRERI